MSDCEQSCGSCQFRKSNGELCRNRASCRKCGDQCGRMYCHLHRNKVENCPKYCVAPPVACEPKRKARSAIEPRWLNVAGEQYRSYNDCITNQGGLMYNKKHKSCMGKQNAYSLHPDATSNPRHIVWNVDGRKSKGFTEDHRWANWYGNPPQVTVHGDIVCDPDGRCMRMDGPPKVTVPVKNLFESTSANLGTATMPVWQFPSQKKKTLLTANEGWEEYMKIGRQYYVTWKKRYDESPSELAKKELIEEFKREHQRALTSMVSRIMPEEIDNFLKIAAANSYSILEP